MRHQATSKIRHGWRASGVAGTMAILAAIVGAVPSSAQTGPIRLMQMGDYQAPTGSWPGQADGAKVAAAMLNASGGVLGRRIEILTCNTRGDVNEGAKCAREATSKGAIAIVGSQMLQGQSAAKVLQKASMASLANQPLAAIDFTSPMSFPLISGSATAVAAACAGLVDIHNIKDGIGIFGVDISAGKAARDACQDALKVRDVGSFVVTAPPGAPDMAGFVAQVMARRPKAVVLSVLPSDVVKIVLAFQQAGFKGQYASSLSLYNSTPQLQAAMAQIADGTLMGAKLPVAVDTKNRSLDKFRADMKRYAPKAPLDDFSLNAYLGVLAFSQVAKNVRGSLTAKSFYNALKTASVTVPGLGTVDYKKPAGFAGQPRIFNGTAELDRFTNGKFRKIRDPFNPYLRPKK